MIEMVGFDSIQIALNQIASIQLIIIKLKFDLKNFHWADSEMQWRIQKVNLGLGFIQGKQRIGCGLTD